MKAIVQNSGKIVDVEVCYAKNDSIFYRDYDNKTDYSPSELEFYLFDEPEEEVTLNGWVAIDEAYDACFLHTSKPHQVGQEIADTGDYDTVWESDGKTYLLDRGLFPDMDCDSEPIECKVTITIKPPKQSNQP